MTLSFFIQPTTGFNALGLAASNNNDEAIDFLIELGVDLNFQNLQGQTPIMTALISRNEQVIQTLLHYKPDLDIQSHDGITIWDQLQEPRYQSFNHLFGPARAEKEARLLSSSLRVPAPTPKKLSL